MTNRGRRKERNMLGINLSARTSIFLAGAIIIGTYVIFGGPGDKRRRRRRKDTIPGLANVGNSCFLNALVQSLASCPMFIEWLSTKAREPSPPLVSSLNNLLKVLNNDGGHGGDACAGEVMCALRGHGWVISMEEQDTHELFHALTATLDEELSNAMTMPSLLDVSWIDEEKTNIYEEGVLIKAISIEYLNKDYSIERENGMEVTGKADCILVDTNVEQIESANKLDSLSIANKTVANQGCDNLSIGTNISIKNEAQVIINGSDDSECNNKDCGVKSCNYQEHFEDVNDLEKVYINGKDLVYNGNNCKSAKDLDETSSSRSGTEDCANQGRNENLQIPNERICCEEPNRRFASSPTVRRKEDAVDRYWKTRPDQHDSPFRGYLASQLQCILCGHKNPAQWASFESISLSLPSVPWGEVTLQELLNSYITQEKVTDVNCDNCTKEAGFTIKTSFTKQLTIGKLPECLCFHVKRTIWLDNGTAIKRRDHVIFSEFLTMDPYTYTTSLATQTTIHGSSEMDHQSTEQNGRSTKPRDWQQNFYEYEPVSILSKHATSSQLEPSSFVHVSRVRCEQLYRLKAVIVHVGDVFCGHFVTYRRGAIGTRTRNRWFYTSDLLVREATLEEVKKANVYMILYEKVTQ